MMGFEIEAALFLLLLLGVGPWAWVRPAVLAIIAVVLVLILVFRWASPPISLVVPVGHYRKELMEGIELFFSSLRALLAPKSLVRGFVLGLFYVLAAALALHFISQGIAPESTGILEATSVCAVSVIASLLSPIPFDIGITEGSGLVAFVAFGTSKGGGTGCHVDPAGPQHPHKPCHCGCYRPLAAERVAGSARKARSRAAEVIEEASA